MKKAEALDEPELTQLLLQLVPQSQQYQYQLIKGTIPVNLRATLNTLKTIENMNIQVPRKPKKLVDKSANGNRKRKATFKDDSLPQMRKHGSKSAFYVLHMK